MYVLDEALLIKACISVTFSFKASFEVLLFYIRIKASNYSFIWNNYSHCFISIINSNTIWQLRSYNFIANTSRT